MQKVMEDKKKMAIEIKKHMFQFSELEHEVKSLKQKYSQSSE